MKSQPPGKWFAVSVLADAIGQERSSIRPCLEYPIKHGVLIMAKRDGLVSFCLADHPEASRAEILLMAEQDPQISGLVVSSPDASDEDEQEQPEPAPAPEIYTRPKREPKQKPVRKPAAAPAEFSFTYSSSGLLTVSKNGQDVPMTMDEFRSIHRFLCFIMAFHEAEEA